MERLEKNGEYKEFTSVIEITGTQQIRVGVKEENGVEVGGINKYWRKGKDAEWQQGKGFTFSDATILQKVIVGLTYLSRRLNKK